MSKTADLALAICVLYPHKSELSKARLTKLVYLCDWESARELGRQITPITWKFHRFGPYVEDVIESTAGDDRFSKTETSNFYGDKKLLINSAVSGAVKVSLSKAELDIVKRVIEETKSLYWDAFIKHVYATLPVAASARYSTLNLVKFAEKERAE